MLIWHDKPTKVQASSNIFNEPEGKRSPETWNVDISNSIEDKVVCPVTRILASPPHNCFQKLFLIWCLMQSLQVLYVHPPQTHLFLLLVPPTLLVLATIPTLNPLNHQSLVGDPPMKSPLLADQTIKPLPEDQLSLRAKPYLLKWSTTRVHENVLNHVKISCSKYGNDSKPVEERLPMLASHGKMGSPDGQCRG